MKATGVVRRIDDLGRIVIPKEIRRNFKINEGDSLEIFVDARGIILKKYSLLDDMVETATNLLESIGKVFSQNILITDKQKVISVTKDLEDVYLNKEITDFIKGKIDSRNEFFQDSEVSITLDSKEINFFFYPLIVNSDALGSIILLDKKIEELDKKLVYFLSSFLEKNIE